MRSSASNKCWIIMRRRWAGFDSTMSFVCIVVLEAEAAGEPTGRKEQSATAQAQAVEKSQ
jgi:hypothetical protein